MSHKYPYNDSRQTLYTPAEGATFFEDWQEGDTSKHNLLCAEMSRLAYAPKQTVTDALRPRGFTLKLWIGGETAAQRLATGGTDGFIATSDTVGLTVLAFRGTESNKPEDILADAFAVSAPWDEHDLSRGRVHEGFAGVYGRVRKDISAVLDQQGGPLLITGHSLGAALATLAAAQHAARRPTPTLITFGSPRVGDAAFARLLDGPAVSRFVDCCDLVTRIPPKEFDQEEIAALLTDLITNPIARVGVPVAANALARAFAGLDIHYVDIGTLEYRDRAGKILQGGTTATDDQRAARDAYHGQVIPDLKDLVEGLLSAARAAAGANDVRDALRKFGATLFQGGRVPLRDLADHAPINYVSLFTGRDAPPA